VAGHIERQGKQQHLEDGSTLKQSLGLLTHHQYPGLARLTSGVGPSGRLFKMTSRNVWQVFLNHPREVPVPNLCCCYHLNGVCNKSYFFKALHITLTGDQTSLLGKWVKSCWAHMQQQPADAAKKSKLVCNPENAYAVPPLDPF
jgi:hypothetical protein